MRSVNVWLLAILVGGISVAGIGVFFLHKYQVKRNAVVYLQEAHRAKERATAAWKANKREDAAEEAKAAVKNYSLYLKLRPTDMEARQEMGYYLAEVGSQVAAIDAFEVLLRQNPERSEVRRKLVDMAMDIGQRSQTQLAEVSERARQSARWYSLASEHLREYLLKESPDDASLWELLGRCQAAMAQDEQALESFEKAVALKPEQFDAYGRMAALLRSKLSRPKDADQWIEKLIQANPESARAHLLAGRYFQSNGELDRAVEEATTSLRIDSQSRDGLLLAAQCAQAKAMQLAQRRQNEEASEQFNRAREFTKRGLALQADDVQFYAMAAEVELRAGDSAKAIDLLRQGLKATQDNPILLWYTADLLVEAGRIDDARPIVAQLEKAPYRIGRKAYIRGRLEYAERRWKDAIASLETARNDLIQEPQLLKQLELIQGKSYVQLGNSDQAMRCFRRALDSDPLFSPAQAAMIELLAGQGKLDTATELYRQLLGRHGGASLRSALRIVLMKNAQRKATERDWLELDNLIDEATKTNADSTETALVRFQSLLARGRADEAEAMMVKCRDAVPDQQDFWVALIDLAQQRRQWEKADSLVADARKRFGSTVALRIAVVRGALNKNRDEGVLRLKQASEKIDKFSVDEQMSLLQGLLQVAMQIDEIAEVKNLAQKIRAKQPTNLTVRFILFEQAMRAGDLDVIKDLSSEIEEVEGRGPLWHYSQAVLLSLSAKETRDDPKLEEALKHLKQAAEQRPSWEKVPFLMAGILDQQQKIDRALDQYRKAVELGERSGGCIRRLAQILFERRAFAEANEVLRLLEERVAKGEDVERLETRLEARVGDYDKSLALARKLATESKKYSDHLWLGTLLEVGARRLVAEGKMANAEEMRDEAEASYRKAVEISDTTQETWLPLIRFFAATDQKAKAETTIEAMRGKLDPKDMALALAQSYEALNDVAKAEAQFEKAVADHPESVAILLAATEFFQRANRFEKAEVLARKVMDGNIKLSAEDLVRTRRLLAVVLGSRGGYANSLEALKLIELNMTGDSVSPLDERIKASVLATLPSRAHRQLAAETFANLVKKGSAATAEDRFILAQLYLAQGSSGWSQFTSEMSRLLAVRGDEPKYLAFYISALLQRGELQTADAFLPKLEKVAPNSFATVSLQADLLVRRGRYEDALQLLKGFVDKTGAEPADRSARIRLVAESLEQLAGRMTSGAAQGMQPIFARDAEMYFRQYIDTHPGQEILLVGFLTRLGLIDDALNALDRVIGSVNNPAILAQAVADLLRAEKITKEQLDRAESLLKSAVNRLTKPVPLLIVLADMYAAHARYDEAEGFYRSVLKSEPDNAVAMNNLAVVMALQKKDVNEALRMVNKAIEIAGPVGQMLDSRATVYLVLGDTAKALKDLEGAIDNLDGPVQHFHQAQAYWQAGKKIDAIAAFDIAKRKKLTPAMLQPLERPIYEELEKLSQ